MDELGYSGFTGTSLRSTGLRRESSNMPRDSAERSTALPATRAHPAQATRPSSSSSVPPQLWHVPGGTYETWLPYRSSSLMAVSSAKRSMYESPRSSRLSSRGWPKA